MTFNGFLKFVKEMEHDTTLKFSEIKTKLKLKDTNILNEWINKLEDKHSNLCYISKDSILRIHSNHFLKDNTCEKEIKNHLILLLDSLINKNISCEVDSKVNQILNEEKILDILESLVVREFEEELKPAMIKSLNNIVETKTRNISEKLEKHFLQEISGIKNTLKKLSLILSGKEIT